MKKLFDLSALVSPRVLLGVGLVLVTSLFGGTGCGLSYSLTGLYVEPSTGLTCVIPGVSAQYHAYGTYTEGGHGMKVQDLTDSAKWSSTIPDVATVNAMGVATGVNDGTTAIIASAQGEFGTVTDDSNIVVESPGCSATTTIAKPFSLHIIPASQNLTVGQTLSPLAIATYSNNGHAADLSRQVTWESSDASVATVDASGLITAVGAGDAVITARAHTPSGETVTATQTVHLQANSL